MDRSGVITMTHTGQGFTKQKALLLVLLAAAVLIGLILLRSCAGGGEDLSTAEGRQTFLSSLGWEIDPASESCKRVLIPRQLQGALAEYNEMQKAQGFDLSKHLGEQCDQVTYLVTNYPNCDQTVLVTLYIQGRRLIAGDIHSTALNGFMHALTTE